MSLVYCLVSQPGSFADGQIRDDPQDYAEIEDSNLESNVWIDTGLDLSTPKSTKNKGMDKLLVVVARTACEVALTTEAGDPDDAKSIPIPVAEAGLTAYSHLLGPETKKVWVKMPDQPSSQPILDWFLSWWPF